MFYWKQNGLIYFSWPNRNANLIRKPNYTQYLRIASPIVVSIFPVEGTVKAKSSVWKYERWRALHKCQKQRLKTD